MCNTQERLVDFRVIIEGGKAPLSERVKYTLAAPFYILVKPVYDKAKKWHDEVLADVIEQDKKLEESLILDEILRGKEK